MPALAEFPVAYQRGRVFARAVECAVGRPGRVATEDFSDC